MNLTVTIESAETRLKQILEAFFISIFDEKSLISHGIDHHRRVWNYSKELYNLIAPQKPAEFSDILPKLIIVSYLHDIGMTVEKGPKHGIHSKEFCIQFLVRNNFRPDDYQDVLETIENHDNKDYPGNSSIDDLLTILSAADDLDAFGFIGIFRYSEIYLTRRISRDQIGYLIKQNAAKRFDNFAKTFGFASEYVEKHKKRFEIIDNFFEEYNKQVLSYNFGKSTPAGHCGVIEVFTDIMNGKITLKDVYKRPDIYYSDPLICLYFNNLAKELDIEMKKYRSIIPSPFNSEEFRKEGHKVVDILSDYLNDALSGKEMPVLPWNDPDKLTDFFSFDSAGGETEPLDSFLKRIIDQSIHIHHPNYIGHQVTSPLPFTVLTQFCTTLLNNGAAIYEMGPVNMAMERNVIKRFGSIIGYTSKYDGIFTHGGTAGNLTAMLAARQAKTDYNIWEEGVRDKERPGYMMSEQSHYSIGRNVKIMGLGEDSIVRIPFDSNFRMRADLLEEGKNKAEDKGIKVISVVANACSTATGSYDNLDKIADFCTKHNLWMHVDGAHGMGVLFSEKFRSLANGIERADSVVIDFHKMFLVPALNTLVMFRNGEKSFETFAQKASYLFQKSQNEVWYNSATRTIECTKSALGIIAYTALKYYGNSYYKEYIESRYDLARTFAALVESDEQFELAVRPESNIVCFRFAPAGLDDATVNQLNSSIRNRIIKEGSFYIVQAELGGKTWIRLTIINPMTTENNLKNLLEVVKDIGNTMK